ncbi:MAG: hypothetical protein Q7T16_03745 [Candidatus Burarchaeum sp.]|nr:hypothetical protein [Candidatus Burarchaeum sp.]MDO8339745.1 hypothetical protein [Candidatus Burarchaeum sp.]
MKRAQVSTEFLLVVIALLAMLGVGVLIFEGQQNILAYQADLDHATLVAQGLAGTINAVHHGGNGTSMQFALESRGDMEVTFQRNYVQVRKNNAIAQAPMVTMRLNTTSMASGEYPIMNSEGVIMIG